MDLSLYKDESQIERKTPNPKRKSNVHSSQSTPAKKSKQTLLKSKSASANKKGVATKRRNPEHDDGDDDKDDEDYSPSKKPARSAQNANSRSTPRRKVIIIFAGRFDCIFFIN